MPTYRSRTSTSGRNMAGARALWRATGMKDGDFSKPIIAVVNTSESSREQHGSRTGFGDEIEERMVGVEDDV